MTQNDWILGRDSVEQTIKELDDQQCSTCHWWANWGPEDYVAKDPPDPRMWCNLNNSFWGPGEWCCRWKIPDPKEDPLIMSKVGHNLPRSQKRL